MITVKFTKNAPSGYDGNGKEEYEITEKQMSNFKKYGNYQIEVISTSSSSRDIKSESPDDGWSNADIRTYLDSKNIQYKAKDTKSQLLALT